MPLMRAAQPGVDPGRLAATLTRGGTVLLALTWGAAASLIARDRPHAARLGLLASGVMALQFDQSAAVLAFVVGVVVFFLTPRAPRIALFAITCGLAAWVLAAPFATPLLLSDQRLIDGLPASWQERASIWRFACEQILREPWLGYGIDSARAAGERIPLHPHSASIQLWYETGAIGALLAAATLIAAGFALVRAFAQDRIAAAAAAATFASLGIVANISYGAWQEWWVATVFVAAALVAAAPEALKRSVDFSLDPATTPQP
jgi:O-antigen ligase